MGGAFGKASLPWRVVAVDPAVRAALESVLAASPDNRAVRLHLASLLLDEDPRVALHHCGVVLSAEPDNCQGLELGARAARAAGEPGRASGYERLLGALGSTSPPATTPPATSPQATSSPATDPQATDPPGPGQPRRPDPAPSPMQREPLAEGDAIDAEQAIDAFLEEILGANDVEAPLVTLAEVAGLDDIKRRLETSFLGPMRNPELRRMYGKSLRGGLLLYGPPGCGKTFLARAVAGELGARFFGIGLHDVLDMWLGRSERNLHEVFQTARRNTPCVLFFDEVDALGLKRSNLSHSAGRNVVVQLLNELDSTRADNEGVFMLGATNQPWDMDPALRRPGRFDRALLVLPPDTAARAAILAYHLRERPLGTLDLGRMAELTEGFSGADLRLLCESAAEMALEDSIRLGAPRAIATGDLDRARREISPSTRAWFEVARNYALFSNEGGAYDDLLAYMRRHKLA